MSVSMFLGIELCRQLKILLSRVKRRQAADSGGELRAWGCRHTTKRANGPDDHLKVESGINDVAGTSWVEIEIKQAKHGSITWRTSSALSLPELLVQTLEAALLFYNEPISESDNVVASVDEVPQ